MLQKISDFIKSELQSMLKNRQQSQQKNQGALPPGPPQGLCPWTPLGAGAPRLAPSAWVVGRIYSIQGEVVKKGGGGEKGYFRNSGGSWLKGGS